MKKFHFLVLLSALAAALTIQASAASFRDVPSSSSLAGEVDKAVEYGLMNGYSATTFGYGDQMTRAQFAAVLTRMMGWKTVQPEAPSLPDVLGNHSWYSVVETALAHDVMDRNVNFRPDAPITRGEMAEMLVRALGLKEAALSVDTASTHHTPFTDLEKGREGYISVAYTIGMTKGITADSFAPKQTATRAQAAAMLVRIYEKLQQETNFVHSFYAISSYDQLSMAGEMDAVSAGWSRMTWDGETALLSTTSANNNEFYIPSGYDDVTDYLEIKDIPLHLSVFMDTGSGLNELLASDIGRNQAVEQIINELTVTYKTIHRNPYSGVTLDFEGLRNVQKANYTAFVSELAARLAELDKSLYICVAPAVNGAYYDGYDYKALSAAADKLILMTYDYDTRDMGAFIGTDYYKTAATAPIDKVYWSLRAAIEQVNDAEKVALGYSCKNTAWKIDQNGKLLSAAPVYPTTETVNKRLQQSDTELGWSETYQQSWAIYTTEDGSRYFLWYQDQASVEQAMQTAKLMGIRSVSVWRLGMIPADDAWNWNVLLKSK